ncbi:MAG TPA: DUF4173 domain-containing protein [Candidatus Limnocylindrales bacterium]|nr:DUF4173 domain-containing protein [Candidatus Limnocylindrales bacterium]
MSSLVRRVLLLALGGGVLFDALVPGNAAGVNAVIVMAAFLVAALLVAGPDGIGRMDPADAWLGPTALVLAALASIRADDWLVTADLLFAAALAAGTIGCLAGGRITRGLVPKVLELAVGAVAAVGIGALNVLMAPRPVPVEPEAAGRSAKLRRRLRRAAPVLRGLVIAVPVVAVFVVLFASADAVFARITSDILAFQPDIDLGDLVARSIVITIVAWGAAGLLGLAGGLLPAYVPAIADAGTGAAPTPPAVAREPTAGTDAQGDEEDEEDDDDQIPELPPAPPAPVIGGYAAGSVAAAWAPSPSWAAAPRPADQRPLRLGTTEAATILVVVDLVFAIFVGLQLAYLFGGNDTRALAGITYAEYARRGFFELVLVAVLAGMLVVTLDLSVARRSRVQLGGALVLLGLTAVVLVSALVRLRLYQAMYGWTELRFVVLVSIGWLAVALAVAAGLQMTRRTRWTLHALGIGVLVALGGMNVVGPQAFVTERNLERAIDPSLVPEGGRTGLDTDYLLQLGDEAVVPVVAAWDRLGEADREALGPALDWRREQLATDPTLQGWPAWNLTRERARGALEGWEAARGTASP